MATRRGYGIYSSMAPIPVARNDEGKSPTGPAEARGQKEVLKLPARWHPGLQPRRDSPVAIG